MSKKFHRALVDVSVQKSNSRAFSKALADYDSPDVVGGLRGIIEKQPDLLYGISILVSEGANANDDGFLRSKLIDIFKTPRHKFVDYEHDVDAASPFKNPAKYKVVGHIYDSMLSTQDTGELIDDFFVVKDGNKWFNENSGYRDRALDIIVAWVIYKFQYPELAQMIESKFDKNDNAAFGVSMEVLFTDYKYRVGNFDPAEDFDFDASSVGAIEARYGDPMFKKLEGMWKKRERFNGQKITRILGGEMFFSGMAITSNRANKRSINLSVASVAKNFAELEQEQGDVVSIIKAVSNKDTDKELGVCELVDGVPVCGCTRASISEKVDSLVSSINDFVSSYSEILAGAPSTQKDKSESSYNDDEDEYNSHMMHSQENLDRAQEKLELLYENNMDKDMSREEMLEFLEEIEKLVVNATESAKMAKNIKNKMIVK